MKRRTTKVSVYAFENLDGIHVEIKILDDPEFVQVATCPRHPKNIIRWTNPNGTYDARFFCPDCIEEGYEPDIDEEEDEDDSDNST
jgi:hypothetical protein